MKELNAPLERSSRPKYRRLADSLRAAIREGQVRPGEELPSSRELARRYRMHRHTVMNALAELEVEGWITAWEKRGYFVTATLPEISARAGRARESSAASKRPYRFARRAFESDPPERPNLRYRFPSGLPDLRHFPMREFKSHLHDAMKSRSNLLYGDPAGHAILRSEVATYLRRVRDVSDRSIVITNGSQEAIFLLAQMFVKPGDPVAVEALGYPPAIEALRFAGAKITPIAIDGEGLVVEDLRRRLKTQNIRFLYLTPHHQYPTTVTLSASRRLELYETCSRHGIIILEDDYDHEFHYASEPVAPLASQDPDGLVMHVATFSKILFPSARVGFMAVPEAVAERISLLKRVLSRQNEQAFQEAIARWMKDGGFERHLRRMRRIYDERREGMIKSLEELSHGHDGVSWIEPDGGMALWLDTGRDAAALSARAKKASILVNPESEFRLDGAAGTHLRLGFSGQTVAENHEALARLFALF